jgi:hypothetical protein
VRRLLSGEQVVVGAHVGMALPKRDIEIKASSNVRDSLGQRWSDDGDVVELQHFWDAFRRLEPDERARLAHTYCVVTMRNRAMSSRDNSMLRAEA